MYLLPPSFMYPPPPQLIPIRNNSILIFIGEGSKILNKNSIYLNEKFNLFTEMNFFDETPDTICNSAYIYNTIKSTREVVVIPKKNRWVVQTKIVLKTTL